MHDHRAPTWLPRTRPAAMIRGRRRTSAPAPRAQQDGTRLAPALRRRQMTIEKELPNEGIVLAR